MGAEDCLQKASRINLLWYHLAISFSCHRKLSLNQMLLSAWGEQRYRCNECVGVLILVSIFGKSSWAWMSDRLTWYILDICSKRFMKSSWCWCQSQGHQWVWMRWPVNPLWNKSNWWWHNVLPLELLVIENEIRFAHFSKFIHWWDGQDFLHPLHSQGKTEKQKQRNQTPPQIPQQ